MAEDPTLWTSICNMALALLRQTLLTDLETDTSNEAALCRAWTHQICDEVLGEHPFACVLERAALSEDTSLLTGSIDPTASITVIGVGTLFLTELEVGDRILVSGETRVVATIVSNLELTVTVAFSDNANDTSPEKYETPLYGYDFQFDLPGGGGGGGSSTSFFVPYLLVTDPDTTGWGAADVCVWFNTTDGKLKMWNGTEIVLLG